MIIAFIWLTSPTSSHALAKAALHGGVKPLVGKIKSSNDIDTLHITPEK